MKTKKRKLQKLNSDERSLANVTSELMVRPGDIRWDDESCHKVMISSTYVDLRVYRRKAIDAIWRSNMYPIGMEAGSASDDSTLASSLKMVEKADIYVIIVAFRYGSIPNTANNPSRLSLTELEYIHANQLNKPCLIFIMSDETLMKFPANKYQLFFEIDPEKQSKLTAFKEQLTQPRHTVAFFQSPDELGWKLHLALNSGDFLARFRKLDAGIKTDLTATQKAGEESLPKPPTPYIAHQYILTHKFFGRGAEFKDLKEWAKSTETAFLVESIGGVGKSGLAWTWFKDHAASDIADLAGAIWWSFYAPDASFTSLVQTALAYVTDTPPKSYQTLSYDEREKLLFDALKQKPYLLVLDGMERLLVAYNAINAAHMADDVHNLHRPARKTAHLRSFTSERHARFFRQLVQCYPTRILITTRLFPLELQDRHSKHPIKGIRSYSLNGLSLDDALELVKHLGVRGADLKIGRFLKKLGFHPLLIGVVCGLINEFRDAPGDFDRWYYANAGKLNFSELESDITTNQNFILKYAYGGLRPELKLLLSKIAAFPYSIDHRAIEAFNPYLGPSSSEVQEGNKFPLQTSSNFWETTGVRLAGTSFHQALLELEDRGLLQWDRTSNSYDLHPVVRSYAFEQLERDESHHTFDQILNYFSSLPPEDSSRVRDINDLSRSRGIYYALIGQERFDEAFQYYASRLSNILSQELGDYGLCIELLQSLFSDTELAPKNSDKYAGAACDELAGLLYLVGITDEAEKLQKEALRRALNTTNITLIHTSLIGYSKIERIESRLATALAARDLSKKLAEAVGNTHLLISSEVSLICIYKDLGNWSKINQLYEILNGRQSFHDSPFDQFEAERFLAEALIAQGKDASAHISRASQYIGGLRDPFGSHVVLWLQGEVAMLQNEFLIAANYFDNAADVARKTGGFGVKKYLGCLARAQAMCGHKREPRRLLLEAFNYGYRGEIHDLYANAAEVYLTLGQKPKAIEYATKAYQTAWSDGPGYSWWWAFERSRRVLQELEIVESMVPISNGQRSKGLPYEDEINELIRIILI